jgi:polyphosphate kinase 2 (PPK2 family)
MLTGLDQTAALDKDTYRKQVGDWEARLYDLTHATFMAGVPVIVVIEGLAGSGKGGAIRDLTEKLDPRGCRVIPITPARTAEQRYPWLWRFWNKIPAHGQTVIFDQSWYRRVLIERLTKVVRRRAAEDALQDIVEFHIGRKEQARRFKKLLKDELTAWQVGDEDARQHEAYDDYLALAEDVISRTDLPTAPWHPIAATDKYHARAQLFQRLIAAYEHRLGDAAPPPTKRLARGEEAAHA